MNIKKSFIAITIATFFTSSQLLALPEMVIGEGKIAPGINLIFEGGIKDEIAPEDHYLKESETDVHIEVLANWSDKAPKGSPVGGHVAYLEVDAEIINEKTGANNSITLTPHLNMSDNIHYAQNIKLPGAINHLYTIKFSIKPPKAGIIGMHYDWRNKVDDKITIGGTFTFTNLDFEQIANSKRR